MQTEREKSRQRKHGPKWELVLFALSIWSKVRLSKKPPLWRTRSLTKCCVQHHRSNTHSKGWIGWFGQTEQIVCTGSAPAFTGLCLQSVWTSLCSLAPDLVAFCLGCEIYFLCLLQRFVCHYYGGIIVESVFRFISTHTLIYSHTHTGHYSQAALLTGHYAVRLGRTLPVGYPV